MVRAGFIREIQWWQRPEKVEVFGISEYQTVVKSNPEIYLVVEEYLKELDVRKAVTPGMVDLRTHPDCPPGEQESVRADASVLTPELRVQIWSHEGMISPVRFLGV
jgi:hypothetical protein